MIVRPLLALSRCGLVWATSPMDIRIQQSVPAPEELPINSHVLWTTKHPGSGGDTYQEFHPDQLPIQTVQVDRIVKTGTIFRILRYPSHLFPIG